MKHHNDCVNCLNTLLMIRATLHNTAISSEANTGQPQYPIKQILEGVDKTVELLAKEVYATRKERKPRTIAEKFNMFVGLKRL
jgi:hypothetical protein